MKNAIIKWAICLVTGCIPLFCLAQTIERQLVGSGGGLQQTGAGTWVWTAGETAISARRVGGVYWGEGFQQAEAPSTVYTNTEKRSMQFVFEATPNPATDRIRIRSEMPLRVQLFSLAGQALNEAQTVEGGSLEIQLTELPSGVYFLRATDQDRRTARVLRIQHIR